MIRCPTLTRLLCCVAWVTVVAARAEGQSSVRLTSLAIEGAHAIPAKEIRAVLATRPGGRWPWSEKTTFDQQAFEADLERIRRFYQDRGYPDARIDNVDVSFNDGRDAVRVTLTVDEGQPLRVARASFVGFEAVSPEILSGIDRSVVEPDRIRDRGAVAGLRQRLLDGLRDHGYAYAKVNATEEDAGSNRVALIFTAIPGPSTTFGPITVVGAQKIEDRIILRQLVLRPGQPFTERQITQSQRRLASLEILKFANVDAKPPADSQPTAIPVTVTVAEDKTHRLELGVGYGTEDRVRASVDWSHLNFLGDARRLTVSGKFSSIDRGGRVGVSQPYFLRRGLSLDASAVDWWTGENIYTSTTHGGRTGVTYRFRSRGRTEGRGGGGGGRPGDTLRVAYVYEFLRYTVRPAVLADLSNVGQLLALGLNPVTGAGRGTKSAVAADFSHSATDNVADPRAGWTTSLHGEVAAPGLGGTFRYRQAVAETRAYLPLGPAVIATRLHAGLIAARSDTDFPFSDRFFLGGASSLRGWSRYEVAPLTDGVPIGGRAMMEMSVELRVPLRGPIGAVGFFDTGNVWARSFAATTGGSRSDAGIGIRYRTPVGLLRGDAAFQLNPIPGLLVDGVPESRTWRIHVSIGQAF